MTTVYFKNLIMKNVFNNIKSPAIPTKYYLGFSCTKPTSAGTNVTEPSGIYTGYSRIELSSLSVPTDGVITNTEDIWFPESKTVWYGADKPAIYYVIYDAQINGNLLMYEKLMEPLVVDIGSVVIIKKSSLHIECLD